MKFFDVFLSASHAVRIFLPAEVLPEGGPHDGEDLRHPILPRSRNQLHPEGVLQAGKQSLGAQGLTFLRSGLKLFPFETLNPIYFAQRLTF